MILYIDIKGDNIVNSSEEVEVYSYGLIDDYFFFIGEKIAREYAEEDINLIRLLDDYEKESGTTPFTEQWGELKSILLGKEPQGVYALTLPKEYLAWLKFSANTVYRNIYNDYYKDMQLVSIDIDIKELYDDSVALMIGEVCRYLDKNADKGFTHLGFDESVGLDSLLCQQITNRSNLCFSSFNTSNIKEAGSFYNGRALLRRGNKIGFINQRGEIIAEKEYDGPYGIVDLGLSVCWAECNLGASFPEECGGKFAWGETKEESHTGNQKNIGPNICDTSYDAVHVRLGGNWRIPTKKELLELYGCSHDYETGGSRVTGPNSNSVFLPEGCYLGTSNDHPFYIGYGSKEYGCKYTGNVIEGQDRYFIRPVFEL